MSTLWTVGPNPRCIHDGKWECCDDRDPCDCSCEDCCEQRDEMPEQGSFGAGVV